ncbi:membrane protein [Vibrio inusitatus NBRC 102082]|uniref:Z-ring associated protein G n=1 Tax=Vibrio inusitatus NBRC 102082 TaxID=1219070 RepID=A0A4Y3HTT6_9VIBR|nr:Z-ring associated protein ZapG [Vibrio inusitatus]GEA50559.1 membrane protein [Vibrio inusitatus NBRC 102082]
MPWIYAIVSLFVGIIIGVIISRVTTPQYQKQKELQKELETSKFELEQQRQDLNDHFSASAQILDNIGKEYRKLYEHMANTSNELLPNLPAQDNPFAERIEVNDSRSETTTSSDEPPKDYANGATGMLKEEQKEILKAPEAIKAT